VIRREQVAELLKAPSENSTVDYKERLNWSQKGAQLELLRDLACLANRTGGFICVGVKQVTGGRLEVVGMAADDPLPDVTKLGGLFREHFAPTVPIEVVPESVEGKTVGVIAVGGFTESPVVCLKNAGDAARPIILRRGALYVRSDAAACEEASPADVDRILNRALEHRTASLRRILQTTGPAEPPAALRRSSEPAALMDESIKPDMTLRAADLYPLADVEPPLRIRELETLLERSRVRGGGSMMFPRYIDRIDGGDLLVLRNPDRLVLKVDREAFSGDGRSVVVASLSRNGAVRVRETLWEDSHGASVGRKKLGVFTTTGFALSALLFAHRYFGALGTPRFRVRIGLVGPAGRMLWRDSDRHFPFFEAYQATSTEDLFVERDLTVGEIDTLDKRKEIAFSITSELFDYFGWHIERPAFDGMVGELGYIEMDGEPPQPIRESATS
jgi:hypothetical protein